MVVHVNECSKWSLDYVNTVIKYKYANAICYYNLETNMDVYCQIVIQHHAHKKELLKACACLTEVNISTKLTFGNILFCCLRQVGCLIKVTANTGLTVYLNVHVLQTNVIGAL